ADSGTPFLLDLPRAQHLTEGDGLELDNGGYMRVRAAPEPVIEVVADSPTDLLRVAWHLGNRHLPLQILEDLLRLRADHVIAAMIEHGSGRIDTDILRDAYRAAEAGDPAALTAANRRGIAFRATSELALESAQQGEAFLGTCVTAWPDPFLAQWADQKNPSPPFRGDREGPDGQRILAGLEPLIASAAAAGKRRDPADFGSATFAVDLASMAHETQYSRLFRS